MRGWKEKRISTLLRMAELCTSDQEERKNIYMDEVDKLLFGDVGEMIPVRIEDEKYKHLETFYERHMEEMNGTTSRNAYALYIQYCQCEQLNALSFLPFCKAMLSHFPIKCVVTHSGKGKERVCFRKWVLANG